MAPVTHNKQEKMIAERLRDPTLETLHKAMLIANDLIDGKGNNRQNYELMKKRIEESKLGWRDLDRPEFKKLIQTLMEKPSGSNVKI